MSELTHTCSVSSQQLDSSSFGGVVGHTLFPDEAVVSVVGVVRISGRCAATVSDDPEVELCQDPSLVVWRGVAGAAVTYLRTHDRTDPSARN